jgi:hypothetical protein
MPRDFYNNIPKAVSSLEEAEAKLAALTIDPNTVTIFKTPDRQ